VECCGLLGAEGSCGGCQGLVLRQGSLDLDQRLLSSLRPLLLSQHVLVLLVQPRGSLLQRHMSRDQRLRRHVGPRRRHLQVVLRLGELGIYALQVDPSAVESGLGGLELGGQGGALAPLLQQLVSEGKKTLVASFLHVLHRLDHLGPRFRGLLLVHVDQLLQPLELLGALLVFGFPIHHRGWHLVILAVRLLVGD